MAESGKGPKFMSATKKPFNLVEAVKRRMMMDPLVFVCAYAGRGFRVNRLAGPMITRASCSASTVFGLTVASLTRGLGAMAQSDARMSQLMMRARVFFQLCTVGAFMGGLWYRGELPRFIGAQPWTPSASAAVESPEGAAAGSGAVELK